MISLPAVKRRKRCAHGYLFGGDNAAYVCHECAVREIERLELKVEELQDKLDNPQKYCDVYPPSYFE